MSFLNLCCIYATYVTISVILKNNIDPNVRLKLKDTQIGITKHANTEQDATINPDIIKLGLKNKGKKIQLSFFFINTNTFDEMNHE